MNTEQKYKIEDFYTTVSCSVNGEDITLYSERTLTYDELKLLDEVLTDTIAISRIRKVRYAREILVDEGYTVEAPDV